MNLNFAVYVCVYGCLKPILLTLFRLFQSAQLLAGHFAPLASQFTRLCAI